ncbi:hypothetical protein JB92DRAFT_2827762 [Gautieria morchelliformis]|nr:hypothetical protein JB92DRAFT_2827762 [Gautieria morchelliformis]
MSTASLAAAVPRPHLPIHAQVVHHSVLAPEAEGALRLASRCAFASSVRYHSYNDSRQDIVSPYPAQSTPAAPGPICSYMPYVPYYIIERGQTVACEVGMVGGCTWRRELANER